VFALARPHGPAPPTCFVPGFAWLGASGVRYVVWFGLVGAPIIAEALPRVVWVELARWRDRLAARTMFRTPALRG